MNYQPISMSSKIYDELVKNLRKSYPNACVLYIDKIVNNYLSTRFEDKKKEMEERGENTNEMILYHGTNSTSVNSIASEGYLSSMNKRSAYGHGTYFSSEAYHSKLYTDVSKNDESFMLVNRVLLGKNEGNLITDKSRIYVVKEDECILPEYVVCFYKNAE